MNSTKYNFLTFLIELKYNNEATMEKKMKKSKMIQEFIDDQGLNIETFSDTSEGEVTFTICDVRGEYSQCESVQCLTVDGELWEGEISSDLVYMMHGLAGAY